MAIGAGVKVKICGITNFEDAEISVDAGCDALGFIFYRQSPRYISPEKAAEIISKLPRYIAKIGVFVNAREKNIKNIAKLCKLDMLQFHGNETVKFCNRFKKYKIIKVFKVKDRLDIKVALKYQPFAYMFDTLSKMKFGGTGESFDWKLVRHTDCLKKPVFLSGGLSQKNVKGAIKAAHPGWVDTCSLLENQPGKKDPEKVTKFIKAAKS